MSPEQFKVFEDTDRKLEKVSDNKKLWTELALIESEEWEECRKQGRELLRLLKQQGFKDG